MSNTEYDLLNPVIMLNTFTLTSLILFRTYNHSDKSKIIADRFSRLLQLSPHLSK